MLLTLLWSHIVSMHIVSMLMLLWSTTTNRKRLHRSPQVGVVPPTELIITHSIAAVVMDDLLMIGGDPY